MTLRIYVIDTSALVDMARNTPADIYPTQWEKMELLIKSERLVAPLEVFEEIRERDDDLAEWAQKNRGMFIDMTFGQIEELKRVMDTFPSLVNENKKHSADPWIIALAMNLRKQKALDEEREVVVVTNERLKGNKVKIPFVCKHFEVSYMCLIDLLREEGWRF